MKYAICCRGISLVRSIALGGITLVLLAQTGIPVDAADEPDAKKTAQQSAERAWKAGDKVDAWNVAWYPATILEIGTGKYVGYYMVHYDASSDASNQWVASKNIRARVDKEAEAKKAVDAAKAGPRVGKYNIYAYGAPPNRLYLGHFELLADGKYRVSRSSEGEYYGAGEYRFDADKSEVEWLSGPFKKNAWGGKFSVTREGKTHTIRMTRSTISTNSTD